MANLIEFTDDNFQAEVLESGEPVLVDFWAPWCQPCKMMMPTIEELAGEYEGRVSIGKLNIDDARSIATSYSVSSIPTVMLFKGGEVVEKLVGVTPKDKFTSVLDGHVG